MSSKLSIGQDEIIAQEKLLRESKDLGYVFKPRSVAVIGASQSPEKIGHQILKNVIGAGFTGKVFPVHPSAQEILGQKSYASVLDIPEPVDLAVIAIPAKLVGEVMKECARKEVMAVAVITSGFAEVGKVEEERMLKELADRHNIALLGPNMFGIVYAPSRLNASFGPRDILPGKIAFISQSGALAIALMGWTMMEKIGLASLVNVGNKADIEEKELIEYFNKDKNVDVIQLYMEGLKDGRKFMQTKIEKPVVVLKVGRSQRGARAAASHTGSLAGSDKVFEAAFKQLGILRADTFTEAFGWSRTLSLPLPEGEETVIITNGGGIGVRTTDECEAAGIVLLDDHAWLEEKFRKTMPDFGSTKNPIDITGEGGLEGYRQAAQIAFNENKIKAVIILYCETAVTDPREIARVIESEYQKVKKNKPVVVALVGGEKTRAAIHYLNEHRIPAFSAIGEAVSALRALYAWRDISRRPKDQPVNEPVPREVVEIIKNIKKQNRSILMEHEAREILQLCGVPVPKWDFAKDLDEAVRKAEGMYPLAMKIASPDIVHKTEVDGVILNIRNKEELTLKFSHMMKNVKELKPQAGITGVNLVQMVKGIECIVGLVRDPQFGPVVMFGLGGIFVEALKDVSFRVVPFGRREAERLIKDIKGREILEDFRGFKAHQPSLIQVLCAVQKLAPVVKEIDINPIVTNASGSFAADARIVI